MLYDIIVLELSMFFCITYDCVTMTSHYNLTISPK